MNKVANGLNILQAMRAREFACLSGGEKTRVNLGRLILEDTDILLLDEPTNHLDMQATEWLEEYLRRFRGTVLTISHDRYFLDRTVSRIIEIQDGKAEFYSGNYSFTPSKGTALSGAHEAVPEGAGQDRPAGKGGGADAPVGVHGQRRAAQAGVQHGKAHRAYAHHRQTHKRPEAGGSLPEPGVQGRRGAANKRACPSPSAKSSCSRTCICGARGRAHRLAGRERHRQDHAAEYADGVRAAGQRRHTAGAGGEGGLSAAGDPLRPSGAQHTGHHALRAGHHAPVGAKPAGGLSVYRGGRVQKRQRAVRRRAEPPAAVYA